MLETATDRYRISEKDLPALPRPERASQEQKFELLDLMGALDRSEAPRRVLVNKVLSFLGTYTPTQAKEARRQLIEALVLQTQAEASNV